MKREDAPCRETPGRKTQKLVPSLSLSPPAKKWKRGRVRSAAGAEEGQAGVWSDLVKNSLAHDGLNLPGSCSSSLS